MIDIKKDTELNLKIQDLAFGGRGIARVDDFVIFVENALPGDEVIAKVYRKKKSYAEARRTEILSPSHFRVTPPCSHFGICGGCKWQDLAYEKQLEFKQRHVRESLEHISGLNGIEVRSTIPSPATYFYRNKIEFSFSNQEWMIKREEVLPKNNFALGFHITQRFDKVLAIDSCHLLSEAGNEILTFTRVFTEKSSLKPYDLRLHEGFWRYLIIREGKNTGERMVNIVTSRFEEKTIRHYGSQLVEKFPELTSIVNNVTSNRGGTAFGEQEYLLFGKDRIHEKLNRFQFEISANSFFQTNSHQAENLYAKVVEYADLKGEEIVFDLYSGTGAIAIFLSPAAKEVVGFEMIEAAVKNAVRNCEINQITNCKFVNQDLRTFFRQTETDPIRPDVIITDPPRDGMHKEIIKSILILAPATIVYVSCNPTTLARDLALLQEKYIVEQIQPIDMFPHTFHIETVTKLKLKK